MEPNKENILALNLLRFFAAGLVFVDHYYSNLVASGYILPLLDSSLFRYLGFFGVATFFIISGFVISLSSENKTTSEFIASRFVRLFPVFWVCVSITVFIVIVFGHSSIDSILSMRYVRNLTMLPQLLWNEPYIDNVYWTLQTELKFYFIIIAFITLKIIQKGRLEKIAFFTSLALLFDCFYHVSFFNNALFAYCSDVVHLFFQNYFEGYLQYFVAGILLYGVYKNAKNYDNYIGIGICLFVATMKIVDVTIIVTLVQAFLFGVVILVSLKKINNQSFTWLGKSSQKVVITLGAMTYPLYLLHNTISIVILGSLKNSALPHYVVATLLVIFIGLLTLLVNTLDVDIRAFWRKFTTPTTADFDLGEIRNWFCGLTSGKRV